MHALAAAQHPLTQHVRTSDPNVLRQTRAAPEVYYCINVWVKPNLFSLIRVEEYTKCTHVHNPVCTHARARGGIPIVEAAASVRQDILPSRRSRLRRRRWSYRCRCRVVNT